MSLSAVIGGLLGSSSSSGGSILGDVNMLTPTGQLSSILQGIFAKKGAEESGEAMRQGISETTPIIEESYDKALAQLQPYANLNLSNVQRLSDMVRSGQFNTDPMNYQFSGQAPTYNQGQFSYNQYADPGAQFRMSQGLKAIEGSAAAKGNQLSSTTMQALQKYGSDLASQEYTNAYSRYVQGEALNQNLYGMNLGEFQKSRQYGLDQAQQNWQTDYLGNQAGFNQMNTLANYGAEAPGAIAGLNVGRGQSLGNLALGRGAVNAAQSQAEANAIANIFSQIGMSGNLNLNLGSLGGTGSGNTGSGNSDMGSSGGNVPYETDINEYGVDDTDTAYA